MKKAILLISALLIMSLFISCSDDDDNTNGATIQNNGLTKDINDFVPANIQTIMKDLGMPIYTGDNPPNLVNSYHGDPLMLIASNLDYDEYGDSFDDLKLKFYNQDNKKLTILSYFEQGSNKADGVGGYIVGNNNKFSVFLKVTSKDKYGVTIISSMIFSGEMTEEGIKDLYISLVMIDDGGDPNDDYIQVGGCRVIIDEDGMSEIIPDIEPEVILSPEDNPILRILKDNN